MGAFIDLAGVSFSYHPPQSPWWKPRERNLPVKNETAWVVKDLNLKLTIGNHVVLFGQAGSGKSTLLQLISGELKPTAGSIRVNGKNPLRRAPVTHSTPRRYLHQVGHTYHVGALPARVGEVSEALKITEMLDQQITTLSSSQRRRVALAGATLSESPVILGDDLADYVGTDEILELLQSIWRGRTVIIATRRPASAEELNLPLLILHRAKLLAPATRRELAEQLACPVDINAWVEGVHYDLIRALRATPGVKIGELESSSGFGGQRMRLTLRSPRYLPTAYDVLSRTPLVKIEENQVPLAEILARL